MNRPLPEGDSIRPLFEPQRRDGEPEEALNRLETTHGDVRERLPRPMTKKEITALQEGKLAGRLRWLMERRADDRGRVAGRRLRRARAFKEARVRELGLERPGRAGGIVAGPAGPGKNWLSVGPRNINGRIKCLAVDPTDGQTLYAGSAAGGVWKTTDGGQSWRPTMHDEASLAIGAIAIDPSDPQTIYAGTGEPVHYVSLPVTLPLTYVSWFYEGEGVFKSTDGGGTWAATGAIGNEFIYRIAVDPFDSSHVLCAGFSTPAGAGGLCQSLDGGTTWTTIQAGVFTDVVFDPVNAGRAYAAQNNGGVIKTIDSGVTWTPRNTGLPAPASIGRVSLSLAAAAPDVLYAMVEDDAGGTLLGVYRTATAAEAPGWSAVAAPPVSPWFVWWCQHIEADPTDATGNIVWAGAVDVARSADGGATWTAVTDAYGGTLPPTHPDQHMLVFDPANANRVFISNDGGVFRGDYTGGATPVDWVKVSTGLVATQFYDLHSSSASRSVFGGGAQDNGSMISTGGLSYRHVFGGDGGYVAFHPTDPYTVYVQYQGAQIQKSTDGANTFSYAAAGIGGGGPFPATVLAMDPANPLILFSGTGAVYRTADGGGTWLPASPALGTVTEVAIAPSSGAVVYAGTVDGELHQCTDGGVTATSFADITPTVPGWPTRWLSGIAVDPANADTVYVSFLGFNGTAASDHVWKGVYAMGSWTWNLRAGGLPDVPVGAIAYDPATADLYVATDVGVFHSTDDGVSWVPFEVGLPNVPVVDLALDPVRNLLRAATHGRGIYQVSLAAATPQVDIYLRDNLLDTGEIIPSPSGVPDPTAPATWAYHWQSADIKVDADAYAPTDALTDGVEFDDPSHPYGTIKIEDIAGIPHENPVRTEVNRVYVQVHNRGWDTAAQVDVKLLYADAGAGLPALPADFWPNYATDAYDQTVWKLIGNHSFSSVLPAVPQVWSFNWTPPMSVSNHVCLLAMLDSPQDPLDPASQTELNVDVLTPNNKRITHRNTHPVDPAPSPGGAPAWATLNFNNAFRENRFFDLSVEHVRGIGRLRVVLPELVLRDGLDKALDGFRVAEVAEEELHRTAKEQLEKGEISEYLARLILENEKPLVLETEPGATDARVRGALIKAGGRVPAVFAYAGTEDGGEGAGLRFDVIQYDGKTAVGGSAFYVPAAEGAGGGAVKADTGRLRIVLEKVQILDDHDPWIWGRGEFAFTAAVYVEGEPAPRRLRIPHLGVMKVSDLAGRNTVELGETLFEAPVPAGRRLTVALHATERDMLNADDESTRYRRTFEGEPRSWVGSYGPGGAGPDREDMPDWRVWYRIEEA
ncbi:MAG TPA: hypothetical protein VFQ45_00755 [Longimicrobium sp.]|nr:hypothetical protein [Longimicrobium sp.]